MRAAEPSRHSGQLRPMRQWLIFAVGVILAVATVGLVPATDPLRHEHQFSDVGRCPSPGHGATDTR